VGENVRGLTNWNGGLVFEEVCAELESYGYQVAPVIIPACALDAPHKRERIWFVAYSDGAEQRNNTRTNDSETEKVWRENQSDVSRELSSYGDAANADNPRLQAQHNKKPLMGKANRTKTPCGNSVESVYTRQGWDAFPTQSPVCSGDDGLSSRLDNITFSKWRNESIKAYGNAIVPQVAYQIFQAIEKTLYL
jgi:DNA (cytosine-5)-methyltransferase 1